MAGFAAEIDRGRVWRRRWARNRLRQKWQVRCPNSPQIVVTPRAPPSCSMPSARAIPDVLDSPCRVRLTFMVDGEVVASEAIEDVGGRLRRLAGANVVSLAAVAHAW